MIYACIGDVHGRGSQLQECLNDIIKTKSMTTLPIKTVLLGDYCDRGGENKLTLDLIIDHKNNYPDSIVLFGNHEELFLGSFMYHKLHKTSELRTYHRCANSVFDIWTYPGNGGNLTYKEFKPLIEEANQNYKNNGIDNFTPYLDFFCSLPDRVKEGNFVFTHAPISQVQYRWSDYHLNRLRSSDVLWNISTYDTTRKFYNIHGHLHRYNTELAEVDHYQKRINCHTAPHLTVTYIDDTKPFESCVIDTFVSFKY